MREVEPGTNVALRAGETIRILWPQGTPEFTAGLDGYYHVGETSIQLVDRMAGAVGDDVQE